MKVVKRSLWMKTALTRLPGEGAIKRAPIYSSLTNTRRCANWGNIAQAGFEGWKRLARWRSSFASDTRQDLFEQPRDQNHQFEQRE